MLLGQVYAAGILVWVLVALGRAGYLLNHPKWPTWDWGEPIVDPADVLAYFMIWGVLGSIFWPLSLVLAIGLYSGWRQK